MPTFPPVDEQLSVLLRGAAQIETEADLRRKLTRSRETGKPLRVKYGIDPTGFDVHLGHTVPLRRLRQFQDLGHTAVLIIGTATAQVGDPSGRDDSRQGLTPEAIQRNADSYLKQISKVVDMSPGRVEVRPNGDWFHRFDFAAMLRLLGSMTVQRMLERDDFSKRIQAGTPIYLHECLYPLMQGHDSVEINADVELGGTEQLFNLMVARRLQPAAGQEPQVCFTMPILRGLDGEKKMGKSLGNYIGVGESAKEQFGKAMSIPDGLMREWFDLLTDRTDVDALLAGHPMAAKKAIAGEVVKWFHGDDAATAARADWEKQFSQKQDPNEIPMIKIDPIFRSVLNEGRYDAAKLVSEVFKISKSEAQRKINEGAVNYGPDKVKLSGRPAWIPLTESPTILRFGRQIVNVEFEYIPDA